jgi:predicted ribosome quality control (RQC) complex YloA/Tae2 family protein
VTFDALAMHAIKDELEANLLGGHIEKLFLLSSLEVGLRIRAQRRDYNLLISVDPQAARVHLVKGTLRRLSDEVTPFLLLLRKYVRDGRITSIEQPALERVLRLSVEKRHEDGSASTVSLIIEVMGRHSNLILVGGDGTVLDALKRIPPSLSRQRPILPHMAYNPPPAVEKLNPLSHILARQLDSASRQARPSIPLWRFLQETVMGLGPLAAREVVYRAFGDAQILVSKDTPWQQLVNALSSLLQPLETGDWTPSVVAQDGSVIHFAPYLLTQFPEAQLEKVGSVSEAVERAYTERLRLRPAESIRAPLRASLQSRLEKVRRKEESLLQALARGEKAEQLMQYGQAILANTGLIARGQTELHWEGMSIPLDPKVSPAENAQRYFKEYTKARDATREIPALLESDRLNREYLEQMLALVELAEDEVGLRTLSRELAEAGDGGKSAPSSTPSGGSRSQRGQQKSTQKQRPGKTKTNQAAGTVKRFTAGDGTTILVGGSAKGNERVTFELGTGGDLWLHARNMPGAHVIVKLGGREPSMELLAEAARLAALYSQGRGSTKVPVDYTLQRYVKKIKGGPPGLVTYSQEKTVRVDAVEEGETAS